MSQHAFFVVFPSSPETLDIFENRIGADKS